MQFAAHATIGLPANSAAWVGADQAAQAELTQLRNSWGPQTLVNVTDSALLSAVSDLPVQPGPNGEAGSWCAHHVLEGILGRCLLPDAAMRQLSLAHIVTAAKLSAVDIALAANGFNVSRVTVSEYVRQLDQFLTELPTEFPLAEFQLTADDMIPAVACPATQGETARSWPYAEIRFSMLATPRLRA